MRWLASWMRGEHWLLFIPTLVRLLTLSLSASQHEVSILTDTQNPTRQAPEQPALDKQPWEGVELGNLMRTLPTSTILWFYNNHHEWLIYIQSEGQMRWPFYVLSIFTGYINTCIQSSVHKEYHKSFFHSFLFA